MKFLHGVEVIEVDSGPRPIRTANTSVIGVVGTAPDAASDTKATAALGSTALDTALVATAVKAGVLGNAATIELVDPASNSATLSVATNGDAVTVNLATDESGIITSTAAEVLTAIDGDVDASAVLSVAHAAGSDGSGVVTASRGVQALSGGADEPFPLNTPVLVAGSRAEAAKLDAVGLGKGTLPAALEGVLDQIGAVVVVVRIEDGETETATLANVVGGVNATSGNLEGVHALLGAEVALGFAPRILCAPGWTHQKEEGASNPVVAELEGIAERLRGIIVADGPNSTDTDAITYASDWGASGRVYVVDPWVKVLNLATGETVAEPASARVAGVIARTDNDRGFWHSPSNKGIFGIVGTARPVDFKLGDAASRANLLNENDVATIIRQDGYRLWGNRVPTGDQKWQFISVRRIADAIHESLQRQHLWAVDRNITKTYLEDVADGVNGYIGQLVELGALLGGRCYPDPDLNTPTAIQEGKVYFNFEFTPPYPAEHVTFRSHLVTTYITEALS